MTKMTFTFDHLLFLLGFCSMWQRTDGQKLGKPAIWGPSEGVVNTVKEFFCKVDDIPEDVPVLYQFIKEGDPKKTTEYTSLSGEPGKFIIFVRSDHDGRYTCKASGHNNTEVKPSYSDPLRFRVIEEIVSAHITLDPPSEEFWEEESVTLQCNVTGGTYVSYHWLLDNVTVPHHHNRSQNQLTIQSLSTSDSGRYTCVASNQYDDRLFSKSSDFKNVNVKEHVSDPRISFEVVKDGEGIFAAVVKCQSEKGTSPITFTLLKNNDSTAEEPDKDLQANFVVPIQLDRNVGLVQCQARDRTRTVLSKPLNITVESVGGAVTMKVDRTVATGSEVWAVWLRCSVERGTFPEYSWFLNNTRLEEKDSFLHQTNAVFQVVLVPEAAGLYHCEAANAFDNTTRVFSQKWLINKEVIKRVPLTVVIIVFTCFFVVIVAVTACCLYGVVLRKKKARMYNLKEECPEMRRIYDDIINEDEDDEVNVSVYEEDVDIVEASRIEDSDEGEDEQSSIADEESDEEKNFLDEETIDGIGTEETE